MTATNTASFKRRLATVFTLVLLAGFLTACGGSASDDSASDTAPTEAESASSAEEQNTTPDDNSQQASDNSASEDSATAELPTEAELDGVQVIAFEGGAHVEGSVDYLTQPPVGGDHNPGWQNCGFYAVELPMEQAVHSLEHGAIWITWAADIEDTEIAEIEAFATSNEWVLASPFGSQSDPIILSAWGRQAAVSSFSDPLVTQFFETYAGADSPTAPEPGALCSKAFGIPPNDTQTIG